MNKAEILNQTAVGYKINRMTYEIWERNAEEKEIYIIGISGVGADLAAVFQKELNKISTIKTHLGFIDMDKMDVSKPVKVDFTNLKNKNVLVIDDVANSGKTMLYALTPILTQLPKKIEIAVLVNRKHKNFPIMPTIIGHEVSTTLQDEITVQINEDGKISVFLE